LGPEGTDRQAWGAAGAGKEIGLASRQKKKRRAPSGFIHGFFGKGKEKGNWKPLTKKEKSKERKTTVSKWSTNPHGDQKKGIFLPK